MAWFDIVGGVAGGLQQGLGEFKQAQRQQQQDQQKAQQDFLAAVESGLVDPLDVSQDAMQGLSPQQLKALFVKDPSGKFMLRMEPGRMGELTRQRSARNVFYGDTFASLPADQQLKIVAEGGINPTEAKVRMSQEANDLMNRLNNPPGIDEYQDRLENLETYAARLTTALADLGSDMSTAGKQRRADLQARLAGVERERQRLDKALMNLYGLPMDEMFVPTVVEEPEPESDWTDTAANLAIGAASLYGGGKALQLGGRYILPRLAPALAARWGIGGTAAATAAGEGAAAAAARRAKIKSTINEGPQRRGAGGTTPPRRPSSGGAAAGPTVGSPVQGPPPTGTGRFAGQSTVNRAGGTGPIPSTAPVVPLATQMNVARPPMVPSPAGATEVFGPKGKVGPTLTTQGEQYVKALLDRLNNTTDRAEAQQIVDELQPLLQLLRAPGR
jgi:hypothetical protein